MKRAKCCSGCRRRHRKCVVQPGATKCGACVESGRECQFEVDVRFRHSYAWQQKESLRGKGWLKAPKEISFAPPEGVGQEFAAASEQARQDEDTPLHETRDESRSFAQDSKAITAGRPVAKARRSETAAVSSNTTATLPSAVPSQDFGASTPSHPIAPPATSTLEGIDTISPVSSHGATVSHLIHNSTLPCPTRQPEHTGQLTEREAFLFMTYIQKLAPSSDACDEARHFTLQVPRLALQNPMIMNGILALASVYSSRCTSSRCASSTSDLESTFYHSRAIELLIAAFAQPPETWDSKLLAAVVMARLYEEYDNETDASYHHLRGARNLLSHEAVARFVVQGGLAEAASWVHLRQAIYVYLVRREPVDMRLESFERSTVFMRSDDSAFANRIVYLFAKLIKLMIPVDGPQLEMGVWKEQWKFAEDEISAWDLAKPLSFEPIFCKAPSLEDDRPFPAIYIAASVPVVAMQYYYAAKAVICLHQGNRGSPRVGYHAARARHDGEQRIAMYLGILMGLALSNEHAINAFYLPSHMLSLCGYCIRDPCERSHTIQYLHKVNAVLKWKTRSLIAMLESQWAEMDGFERRK